ncbi:MAG: hypothetical protein BRC56_01795, partial [Cyanobacteria bacterium SW_9_47_5]
MYSADLSGAVIDGGDLSQSNCKTAEFASTVNLYKTLLPICALFGSEVSEFSADLREAPVQDTLFGAEASEDSASLRDAPVQDTFKIELRGAHPATLIETDLQRGNFEDADLGFTDLREARLTAADCENAQFDEANLNRATLENADISSADFSQTYLYQTRLDGAQINDQTQFHI